MKEGALPSRNLPTKSIPRSVIKERSTSALDKVEKQRVLISAKSPPPAAPAYKNFADFNNRITKLKLDPSWSINVNDTYTEIRQFTKAADGKEYVLPYIEIFVNPDLSYVARCFGWVLPKDNLVYGLNSTFRDMTLTNFISKLKNYHPCSGLNLFEFKEAIHLKHHTIPKNFNYLEYLSSPDPHCETEFIRASKCSILIKTELRKCSDCHKLELQTRSQLNAKKRKLAEPAKTKAPITFTSPDRIKLTLQSYRMKNKQLEETISKITNELKRKTLPIDNELNNDLVDIFKGIPKTKVPPFMKLFWEEQQKYLRCSNTKQIRYHPAIIKYCLSIAAKSPAAYDQLRLNSKAGTGILVLPSQRTLRDYRNYIRPKHGFNPEVIADLTERTKDFSDQERFVTILFDEMKVQEDLVWDKSTGELIGFVDLGDEDLNESTFTKVDKLASHILVFIAKSVVNPLSFSFANLCHAKLFPIYCKKPPVSF